MFYGSLEVESIENGIATFKTGEKINFPESNKYLLTENAIGATELTDRQVKKTYEGWMSIIGDVSLDHKSIVEKIIDDAVASELPIIDLHRVFTLIASRVNELQTSIVDTLTDKENILVVGAI